MSYSVPLELSALHALDLFLPLVFGDSFCHQVSPCAIVLLSRMFFSCAFSFVVPSLFEFSVLFLFSQLLLAVSDAGLEITTCEIMTWNEVTGRLGHNCCLLPLMELCNMLVWQWLWLQFHSKVCMSDPCAPQLTVSPLQVGSRPCSARCCTLEDLPHSWCSGDV